MGDTYCVWPDGTVCYFGEVEAYLGFMSDDYALVVAQSEDHARDVALAPISEQDRDRIVALGHLCELAARSAALAEGQGVVRFHQESAAHFSALAFKVACA